jgi:predicted Zn-dependent protease
MALHLYIHAVEASPTPEKAEAPADRLRNLTPGLGHLVHMPSHIDIRLGKWQKAIETNQRAIDTDRRYTSRSTRQGFYRLYMAHNRHMLAFAAMMQGERGRSTRAVAEMLGQIPAEFKEQNAALIDGFFAMPYELLVRFGRWEELLAQPEPPASFPITRALRHEARGVALAALGRVEEARASQHAFRDAVAKTPKEATFGNNAAADLFAIADSLLEGEILFREGKKAEALTALREAVRKNDQLRYDEPPDWILPARHSLGASLLAAGEAAEAEQVYRADLRQWPQNGWSLFGLAQSLEVQGKGAEAARVRKQFQKIWKHADVQITSSCFCQPGKH